MEICACPPTACAGPPRRTPRKPSWPPSAAKAATCAAAIPATRDKGHGFIDSQKHGMEVFRNIPPEAPAGGGGSRLAVQPSRAARPVHPPRAHPDGRQLERPVAGPGRHAQPERLAHQGRRALQHAVERGFHGRILPRTACASGWRGEPCATTSATCSPLAAFRLPADGRRDRHAPGAATAARQGHPGRLRRRLHGHVQRHHPRRAAACHRRVQGAAEPVRALSPTCGR